MEFHLKQNFLVILCYIEKEYGPKSSTYIADAHQIFPHEKFHFRKVMLTFKCLRGVERRLFKSHPLSSNRFSFISSANDGEHHRSSTLFPRLPFQSHGFLIFSNSFHYNLIIFTRKLLIVHQTINPPIQF